MLYLTISMFQWLPNGKYRLVKQVAGIPGIGRKPAIDQLWLFWLAPLVGAALAGVVYRWVGGPEPAPVMVTGEG